MRYLKYEFNSYDEMVGVDGGIVPSPPPTFDENGVEIPSPIPSYNKVAVIPLGHLELTPAIIGEDGTIIQEAVLSNKFAVDILWEDEPNPNYAPYIVWPKPDTKKHTIFGMDELYESEYMLNNPTI